MSQNPLDQAIAQAGDLRETLDALYKERDKGTRFPPVRLAILEQRLEGLAQHEALAENFE